MVFCLYCWSVDSNFARVIQPAADSEMAAVRAKPAAVVVAAVGT